MPKVSVYYMESETSGYVNIQGTAEIINDRKSKEIHWKEGWEEFYPDKEKDFILIKITPQKMQIVSYDQNVISESEDWKATEFLFP